MSWLLNNPIGDRWHERVRYYAELYEKEALKSTLTKETLFEIASVLVRSNCSSYIKRSIDILEHLTTTVDSETAHKSYLIYLTIAYIRLKVYDLAQNCLNSLISIDAKCRQAIELEACLVRNRLNNEFKANGCALKPSEEEEKETEEERELSYYLNSTAFMNQTL